MNPRITITGDGDYCRIFLDGVVVGPMGTLAVVERYIERRLSDQQIDALDARRQREETRVETRLEREGRSRHDE
jgi:hypothetical protein